MKKIFALLLSLILTVTYFSSAAVEEAPSLKHDVIVLFTSDVHCGVDQNFTYVGLRDIKNSFIGKGYHVLLVDDGDNIQGEPLGLLTHGQGPVELMNVMGYDVAIPGNHEFDYGLDRFMELAQTARFPYISCNFRKQGELVFQPYVIKEFDGVKIAFVGVTTPETLTSSIPLSFQNEDGHFICDFTQGGDGSAFYAAVQKAVDDARAEGAQYVFLLAHLGNEASSRPYTYADVIEHTNGIDAMLDGHSHDTEKAEVKNKDGKMVLRQACGTKMEAVGYLTVSAADGSLRTGLFTWNNPIPYPDLMHVESRIPELDEAVEALNAQLTECIGRAAVELTANDPAARDENNRPIRIIRRTETNLGDLCADAFRKAAGADIALVNGGCIRESLQKGDFTANEILKVFPFGNSVVMEELTGRQILNALEWGARAVPEENSGFLHVSGLTYEIHTYIESSCTKDNNGMFTGVTGEYRVKNVMVGSEPLDLDKTYTVVSSANLMLANGDGNTAFDGAKILWKSDNPDFQILIDFIRNDLNGEISVGYEDPYGQGRIIAVGERP